MEISTSAEPQKQQEQLASNETLSLKGALSLEAIAQLRDAQRQAYIEARFAGDNLNGTDTEGFVRAQQAVHDRIDAHVASVFGENAAQTDARAQGMKQLLETYSYANVSDRDWYTDPSMRSLTSTEPRGMDRYAADSTQFVAAYETPSETAGTTDESTVEEEPRYPELDSLRDELSTLTAKRQGRVAGKGGEAYAATHDAYMDQVIAAGKIENEAVLNDETLTDEQKNAAVISYLFEEQRKLREQTTEKLKGTKVGKFVEWMNRGGRTERFFKGALVGAGVGVAAAGIGALAGVAGAAAVGAGVAAVGTGAWRFARGFARADARGGRGMAEAPDLADHGLDTHVPAEVEERDGLAELFGVPAVDPELEDAAPVKTDHVDLMARRFADVFERDTQAEQNKRRKAVVWGLGGVAAGAALGGIASHFLIDAIVPDADAAQHAQGGGHEADTDTGNGSPETTPDTSGETGGDGGATVEAPAAPELDADYGIQYGEGGIHFFQRLGLTEADWYQTQNDLLAKFPQDFYDPDGTAGPVAVRIAHPGQLSLGAQQYIKGRFNLS